MRLDAVLHIPISEYAHGLDLRRIVYRLRCARGDMRRVTLWYGDTACRVTPIEFTPAPMELAASGSLHDYWQVVVDSPYDRVYYYFELDDGKTTVLYYGGLFTDRLVDDRSQYFKLPINHRADVARVPKWVHDAVVYNIFPDSFASGHEAIRCQSGQAEHEGHTVRARLGGTLDGVRENIGYLQDLGVNCVYFNPLFAAGAYHKYDLLDYYHIDPCFGGDEAFRALVDMLHGAGIRVIIDGVFNHCGWYWFAFDDVVKHQEKSRYRDWFYHLDYPVRRPADPEEYPPYACYAYERTMPKLDTANPEVRGYFCRVGRYWIEKYHIDGWRLDVASEVDDGFWRAFRQAVKASDPEALLIGEVWESASHWLQGDMFDSTMNYDLRKHSELFFADGSIDAADFAGRVGDMLMRYRAQMVPAQLNLLDSHDVPRFLSLCGGDTARYKLAALFMFCCPGMPTVFYGDELGVTGITEEEYRRPMPWQEGDQALFAFFKRAVALRRDYAALRRGIFRILKAERDSALLVFSRTYERQAVTICLNAGADPAALPFCAGAAAWSEGLDGDMLDGFGFAVFIDGEC